MNKTVKTALLTAAALVVVILIFLPKFTSSNPGGENSGGADKNAAVSVKAVIIKPVPLDNKILSSGTILANEEVELKPEISGKVTRIYFKEGSFVEKGAMLVKINDEELQAQLKRAEFRKTLLSDKEERQKTLLEREAISQEEYDISLNELNITSAEVDIVKAQIAKTEIRAPFGGYIGLKNISEGSFVNTSTVIASLQEIRPIKIDFSIPERYSSLVKAGDELLFSTSGSDAKLKGRVLAVEPRIDVVTRTIKIRGIYDNKDGRAVPGAFADVELVLKQIDNALLVPTQSVIPELKGQRVFLYRSGKVVPQPIEIGIRTERSVQVTDGLAAGDTVITTGILQIRPEMPVIISEIK